MSGERLSGQAWFARYVLPAVWLAFMGVWLANAVVLLVQSKGSLAFPVLVPALLLVVVGALFYRKLVWELADEVVLRGDVLYVRRRGVEQRIRLAEVVNVEEWRWVNPRRVTLRLRTPGPFGVDVAFHPHLDFQFNPFARHPVAEMLIERVDAARRREMP